MRDTVREPIKQSKRVITIYETETNPGLDIHKIRWHTYGMAFTLELQTMPLNSLNWVNLPNNQNVWKTLRPTVFGAIF